MGIISDVPREEGMKASETIQGWMDMLKLKFSQWLDERRLNQEADKTAQRLKRSQKAGLSARLRWADATRPDAKLFEQKVQKYLASSGKEWTKEYAPSPGSEESLNEERRSAIAWRIYRLIQKDLIEEYSVQHYPKTSKGDIQVPYTFSWIMTRQQLTRRIKLREGEKIGKDIRKLVCARLKSQSVFEFRGKNDAEEKG